MLPTLVLVGRPNVGKSTLFNRLTRSRDALVADFPGLTRDRHFGRARIGDRPYLVVDTGGFEPVATEGIMFEMARQTRQAIAEADIVMFLVDARQGVTPQDKNIADLLRRSGRPIVLVANKAEGLSSERAANEFYELGLARHFLDDAGGVLGLEAAGVDDDELVATDDGVPVVPIARQAGEVGDDGVARLRQAIEERRLADVRSADEGDDGFHRRGRCSATGTFRWV